MRKFAREWIQKYPSIAKINQTIAGPRRMGSERTVEDYVKAVKKFIEFLGETDPEMALRKMRKRKIKAAIKVDKFIDEALLTYAHGTVRNYMHGIKKWLELSGIKVDWSKIEPPTSSAIKEEDRAPTKDEIKLMLNHAGSARDRAVILALATGGLRIGALLTLRIKDVNFDYPDVARIRVERRQGRKFIGRRGIQGRVFFTWLTPEAKNALMQYLKERENAGEKLSIDSPLIGDAYYRGKFVTIEDYEKVWARLLRRAGLAEKSHYWFKLHIHTLRKFFRSNCVGVDESYRERWMGHRGKYLDESYFRAEEQMHLAEYRKAIPYLTIYSTGIEEKQLRAKALLDFAHLQGYEDTKLKQLKDILERSKGIDDAIREFRHLKEEPKTHDGVGKYQLARGEGELIHRLNDGWRLTQSLGDDKFLIHHT
jgi:integrase